MMKNIYPLVLIGIILGCASVTQRTYSPARSEEMILKLKEKLQVNPKDAKAWLELGIIEFEKRVLPEAQRYLARALQLNPNDPKTLYYLGMTLEFQQNNKIALKAYQKYASVSWTSPYRKLLEGRYLLLSRQMLREQMQSLLAQEQQLTLSAASKNTVAVFPLAFQGQDEQFAALGRGVSEMLITDLSQVPNLKLVERVRLQALMDEIALGQTGMVDASTAPRFGKLLGAAKIVHGSYDLLNGKNLQLDVAFWDVASGKNPNFSRKQDALNNLFLLEKDLVFRLISSMDITLTAQEREKIQRVPTQNIQAFMAYCMGLEKEDAGQFEAASKFYQQAVQMDQNFQLAGDKLQKTEAVSEANKDPDKIAFKDTDRMGSSSTASMNDLISDRLQNLSASIGSTFIPGQDSRESVEEATRSEANIGLGDLPVPPRPPDRK